MEENFKKPELTLIKGGLSDETPKVKATTGLKEGQVGPVLEKQGFIAKLRRSLSGLYEKT